MSAFVRSTNGSNLVVSSLIRVEVATAISRLRRGGRLQPDEATAALNFLTDAIERMVDEPLTPVLLQRAAILGTFYSLRALDAIHLASAVVARNLLSLDELRFVCSDKELIEAAQKEGFKIWNPCD